MNEASLKGQARLLRKALAEDGVEVGQRTALNLVARSHGWRDWNTLHPTLTEESAPPKSERKPPPPAVVMATDGRIPNYLHSTFHSTDGTKLTLLFDQLPEQVGEWRRDRAHERDMGGDAFISYRKLGKEEVSLAFALGADLLTAEVTAVFFTREGSTMTLAESNTLEQSLVSELTREFGSKVRLTQRPPYRHLRDLISPDTYRMFQNHSFNKSTGNSHPADHGRWLKFIWQAHSEGLTSSEEHRVLVRAALRAEGFSERHADQMAQDFVVQMAMAETRP